MEVVFQTFVSKTGDSSIEAISYLAFQQSTLATIVVWKLPIDYNPLTGWVVRKLIKQNIKHPHSTSIFDYQYLFISDEKLKSEYIQFDNKNETVITSDSIISTQEAVYIYKHIKNDKIVIVTNIRNRKETERLHTHPSMDNLDITEFNKGWLAYDVLDPNFKYYITDYILKSEYIPLSNKALNNTKIEASLSCFSDKESDGKSQTSSTKSLNVTGIEDAKQKVSDIEVFGNGDAWQLIGKASSKSQGWMKSTKAYEIEGVGCLVQVSTQQFNHVAEAVVFVPNTMVITELDDNNKLLGRKIVKYDNYRASRIEGGSKE